MISGPIANWLRRPQMVRLRNNGFLLVIPILIWNVIFWPLLPVGAGSSVPVPASLQWTEHVLRAMVFGIPVLLTIQSRKYPGDFVFTFIEAEGRNFNYGIDYVECANWKFLKSQGALELMPYICATDSTVSEMLGWGLTRTMTLAEGCDKCDFRFKK